MWTHRNLLILCFLLAPFGQAFGAEFSAYVVATSDYVKRGVTQSNGDPAIQLAFDVNWSSGWYAGTWASTVDINNGPDSHRDLETNLYLGYTHELSNRWQIGANAVAYRYPGASSAVDYDYVEYSVTTNFDDWLWLEYSYSPDLYHSGQSTQNIDIYAEWPFATNWAVGAGVGQYDVSNFSGRDYNYWQLGVTRYFRYADVDLRFHDASRWVRAVSSPDRADPRVALTISVPFSFGQ